MSSNTQGNVDLKSIMHGSIAENPWGQASKQSRFPKLDKDLEVDVCIVGGGVAGTEHSTEASPKRQGRGGVGVQGSGNSGRHTGELTTWKKAQYASMHSYYDKPTVVQVAESHQAAIQHVEETVKELGIQCGLKHLDAYVFTYAGQDAEAKIHEELAACRDAGLKDVSQVDGYDLGKESGQLYHALKFPGTIVLDPISDLQEAVYHRK